MNTKLLLHFFAIILLFKTAVSSPLGASKVEKASLVGSIGGNNGIQTRVARSVLPQEKALLHLVT
ncbi:hypothetical protein Anas_04341 [Armadillidium nasatum]|uniref:Uncharacterized protein n=1 Tax=Armadillidium nasatum TaxID=96803 RepID=A0A5N5SV25_9CRUS|nr:hypothetical protein Anas_04341 [Armadillidium nasatum]